jgi:hypothetical protein
VITALCVGVILCGAVSARADGVVIDKIYHPYVQPLEQELEWRAILQNNQPVAADNLQLHRFAYGHSLGDRWFGEAYVVGQAADNDGFSVTGYELEAMRQLTEQGEFWADWALLFELERTTGIDSWEFSTGVLVEKEWGQWSGTANFFVAEEWGSDIANELDSKLGLQARYRYAPSFEPAIEIYSGENTRGIGPAVMGQIRLGIKRKIHWEAGAIFGLENQSPDQTYRLLLEFEF